MEFLLILPSLSIQLAICFSSNLLLAQKMIKRLSYLRDFWERMGRCPFASSQAHLDIVVIKQFQPQNRGKRTVAVVTCLPRTVAFTTDSPWGSLSRLFLILFLSAGIVTGRHPQWVKNSSFEGQGLVKRFSRPAKSIKEQYPSIKPEFGV